MDSKKYEYLVKKYDLNEKNLKSNLRRIFEPVAKRIVSDVRHGSNDDYIKDNHGRDLKKALDELSRCGISGLDSVKRDVEKHCWYIDINASNVKKLQQALNDWGYGQIDESGIYDKKTHKACGRFVSYLMKGVFPSLTYIDPFQSHKTGIVYENVEKNKPKLSSPIYQYYSMENLDSPYKNSIIFDTRGEKKKPLVRLDKPHFEDGKPLGYHLNVETDVPKPLQKFIYNHKGITEETFLMF